MREANNPEEAVRSRLQTVLTPTPLPVRGEPPPAESPGALPRPAWPTGDEGPTTWAELIPGWPDDVDLDDSADPVSAGSVSAGSVSAGSVSAGSVSAGSVSADRRSAVPAGAAERIGIGAFDPGRPGVKALAAVAALVVLIAGFFAWRARPQVDPVPPVPVAAETMLAKPSGGAQVVIAVAGKVKKPGLVQLPAGSRVADALQAAGGADPGVDVALLNLARKVVDGELILVGVTAPPGLAVAPGAAGGAPHGPVNLNTATIADLDTLPGVGPVLAQRILDARAAQGGFKTVSDLRKVDGIGDSRYEQLKDLVTV